MHNTTCPIKNYRAVQQNIYIVILQSIANIVEAQFCGLVCILCEIVSGKGTNIEQNILHMMSYNNLAKADKMLENVAVLYLYYVAEYGL